MLLTQQLAQVDPVSHVASLDVQAEAYCLESNM